MSPAASFATAAARSKAKAGAGREGNGERMGLGLARNSNRQGVGASEWRTWERAAQAVSAAKGERGGGSWRKKVELTGGPALSAKEGEGREEVGWRLLQACWASAQEEGEGAWAESRPGRKEREGEGIGFFLLIFQ